MSRIWVAALLVAAVLLVGGAGCWATVPHACYRECMRRQQRCVTAAHTTNQLEWCDYYLQRCRRECLR